LAKRRPDNPELMPLVKPPQDYLPIDGALPAAVNFGPAERARMVKQSVDVCEKKGVLGSGYIPKLHWTDAQANSEGLFAYYRYAEASFILTCRTPDGTGSGWAGTTNVKDISQIDAAALLIYRSAWTRDVLGTRVTREASMAKMYATEAAQQVIDAAVQLFGGLGVVRGMPVERLYREIRALRIYEGASEVLQLIIGGQVLQAAAATDAAPRA